MRILGAAIFILTLLVPLVAASGFGYDHPRLPVLTGLATLMLLLLVFHRGRETGPSPLLFAALLFFATALLSIPAGICAWDAVEPLLVLGSGVAVFLFARGGPLPPNFTPRAIVWIIAALGLAVAALGIVQRLALGLPALSTEGNTNYAGALAAILLPAAGAFAFLKAGVGNRVLCFLAVVVLGIMLLLTDSRAGLVAAFGGCAVTVIALALKRVPWARWAAVACLVLLVAVPLAVRGSHHLSAGRGQTISIRLEIWKSSASMFADRPWIGGGLGSFWTRYPPYRSDEEFLATNKTAGQAFVEAEDPHSSWIQVAVETGAAGLLALLFVVFAAARRWGRAVKSAPDAATVAILAGLGGGAAAYLIAGLFNTLTAHASHTLLFWTFLGLIERAAPSESRKAGTLETAGLAMAALAAIVGTYTSCRMSLANHQSMTAMIPPEKLNSNRLMQHRMEHLERALAIHPAAWRARYELGIAYTREDRLEDALKSYNEVLRRRPYHVPSIINKAGLLFRLEGDPEEIEELYTRAVDLAPLFHPSHFGTGLIRFKRGRYAEARDAFKRTLELRKKHPHAHFGLAETYLMLGDVPRAMNHYLEARDLGFPVAATLRKDRPAMASDPRFTELFR